MKAQRCVIDVATNKTVEDHCPLFVDARGAFCASAISMPFAKAQKVAAEVRGALRQLGVHDTVIVEVKYASYWGI